MIKFYRTNAPYGWLSNFSRHAIVIDKVYYLTVEHYYQSQKFLDTKHQELIRSQKTPKLAKQIACGLSGLREDWEEVKYDIMLDGLRAKVGQHSYIKNWLLETGAETIAEASPTDYVWGIGADGTGQNLLGKAWMWVRNELLQNQWHEVLQQVAKNGSRGS